MPSFRHFISLFFPMWPFFCEAYPASVLLLKTNFPESNNGIAVAARYNGLDRGELDRNQIFTVIQNGKTLGTLIAGKGWSKEIQPVCFIGWSKDGKSIDQFMPTIGQGDWETVGCHKIDSVGLISKKDDQNAKLAVIYTIEASDHYGNDYYVVGFNKSNDIFYDESTTEKFQNSYLKTIADLRKVYQK